MARLVSARCPQCGANVRLDPGLEWVTCSYCQTSSFIQTPKRQPTRQLPAHQPVIYVKSTGSAGSAVVVVVSALLVLVIGAVAAGVVLFGSASSAVSFSGSKPPSSKRSGVAPKIVLPAVAQVKVFEDATPVPRLFAEKLGGPVQAVELVLYPEYAILEAQDPKKPQNVDRYILRGGIVGAPDPVRLSGRKKEQLKKHLFALADIDFKLIPKMVQDAPARLGYEGSSVSHIILSRGIPFNDSIRFRVYVSSDRESGSVEYSTEGKMLRVFD